jgi:peptidoglycan/LPS O-acetylase OafA/YrhL
LANQTNLWLAMAGGLVLSIRAFLWGDRVATVIVLLGCVLAILLINTALTHPEGFVEVQESIVASLIVALASSSIRESKRRKTRARPAKASKVPSAK